MTTPVIAARQLRQWIAALLSAAQVPEGEAQLIAAVLGGDTEPAWHGCA